MSDRFLPHVAAEIIGRPLLILPAKLGLITAVLGERIGLDDPRVLELGPMPEASRFAGRRYIPEKGEVLPYARTDDGAGIITITGSLVNRGAWVGASSGLTSYEGIKHQFAMAAADPEVGTIIVDMETPGGGALGAFEAAEAVRAAAQVKPVIVVVNGMAASAGYLLASAASRIVTTPSGMSGSIGVRLIHIEQSRKLDRDGITPTIISAGEGKDHANPLQPLSVEARAELQGMVDETYSEFVAAVAAGRKRLSAKAVRALGARVYRGQEAVDAGLADEIGTFESVLSTLPRGAARRNQRSPRMSAEHQTFTQADLDAAVARARAEGETSATAAIAADRARVTAIMALPEAQGRDALANKLGAKGLSVEDAREILAASPKLSALAMRAGAVTHLDLGGPEDSGTPRTQAEIDKQWAEIVDGLNAEFDVKPPRRHA